MIGVHYRRIIGVVALGVWLTSLALPVEKDCGFSYAHPGYMILASGWIGPLGGLFGWYANPFMLWQIGRLLLGRSPGAIGSVVGLVLALSAFLWTTTPQDNGFTTMCERKSGFYMWIACAVLLAAIALLEKGQYRQNHKAGGIK